MINPASTASLLVNAIDAKLGDLSRAPRMSNAKVEATAKDFESMFIAQMLEPMFGESVGFEAFGDSDTFDIYKGLLVDAYGKEISASGGIGIAAHIKQELLRLQEV